MNKLPEEGSPLRTAYNYVSSTGDPKYDWFIEDNAPNGNDMLKKLLNLNLVFMENGRIYITKNDEVVNE